MYDMEQAWEQLAKNWSPDHSDVFYHYHFVEMRDAVSEFEKKSTKLQEDSDYLSRMLDRFISECEAVI